MLLNGNETGSILLYYILLKRKENGTLRNDATVVKTIVTTDIVFKMAREFNVRVKEVLTGFKYIGEALEDIDDYLLGLEKKETLDITGLSDDDVMALKRLVASLKRTKD